MYNVKIFNPIVTGITNFDNFCGNLLKIQKLPMLTGLDCIFIGSLNTKK
jgi:hypothetical protein